MYSRSVWASKVIQGELDTSEVSGNHTLTRKKTEGGDEPANSLQELDRRGNTSGRWVG